MLSIMLPKDLATNKIQSIIFYDAEADIITKTIGILAVDLGFEYMKEYELKRAVHMFAAKSVLNPRVDPTSEFFSQHFKEPLKHKVFIAVEGITVKRPIKLSDITLYPPQLLQKKYKLFDDFVEVSCVAVLSVVGTNNTLIRSRSIKVVESELRKMRIMLANHRGIPDIQLRFRVGKQWAIPERVSGYRQHPEKVYDLTISHQLLRSVSRSQKYDLLNMEAGLGESITRRVELTLHWLEQAQISVDTKMKVLFSVFALESLFGKKDEKYKGASLGYRCTLLSYIMDGAYFCPDIIPRYYNFRSSIVHGGNVDTLNSRDVTTLIVLTREALFKYLRLAGKLLPTQNNKPLCASDVYDYMENHKDSAQFREMFGLTGER